MDKAIRDVLTEAVLLEIMRERTEGMGLSITGEELMWRFWARDEVFLPPNPNRKFFRAVMVRLVATGLVQQVRRDLYRLAGG